MTALVILSILLTLASIFGLLNERLLRLPSTIGLLVISLAASATVIAADRLMPELGLRAAASGLVASLDLPRALLDGALSVLLFAGSLSVDLDALWSRKWTVLVLAIFSTLAATGLFAAASWGIFQALGLGVPFAWCAVLGAILAPTDPVVVVAMLRRIGLPPTLEAIFAGESLFNDGVGVVLASITLALANGDGGLMSGAGIAASFATQALGGAVLGLVTGAAGWFALRHASEAQLSLTISLALATGTYGLAAALGTSGPIAVVVAGLLTSGKSVHVTMASGSRELVLAVWSLFDEILNALLFLLIGFELLAISIAPVSLLAAALAIPFSIAARYLSVVVPVMAMHFNSPYRNGGIAVLTWGGLRGGISIALALNLPDTPWRGTLLTVCYAIVIFSVVIQGLTMQRLARRYFDAPGAA